MFTANITCFNRSQTELLSHKIDRLLYPNFNRHWNLNITRSRKPSEFQDNFSPLKQKQGKSVLWSHKFEFKRVYISKYTGILDKLLKNNKIKGIETCTQEGVLLVYVEGDKRLLLGKWVTFLMTTSSGSCSGQIQVTILCF